MKILELPPNVPPERLQEILNDRIRDINAALALFVENPALAEFDAGQHRIVRVADPQNDLDAVNLRTLKKQPIGGDKSESRHISTKPLGLDAYAIVFAKDNIVQDADDSPAYTIHALRTGIIEEVSVTAEIPASGGALSINAVVLRPKVHEDDPEPVPENILTEPLLLPAGHFGPLFSVKIKFTDMLLKGARIKPVIVAGNSAGLVSIEVAVRRRTA